MENNIKERLLYNKSSLVTFNENNHRYSLNGTPGKDPSVTKVTGRLDKPALKFWSVKVMHEHILLFLSANPKYKSEQLLEELELARKEHTRFKEEAATFGSLVHSFAEQYILFQLKLVKDKPTLDEKADEKVKNGILAFLQWVDFHKIKFIASEQLLYSKKYKYFGLADCIAKVDGKLTLIDFKTSNFLSIDYYAQAAAYAYADMEESGKDYDQVMIAKFSKDTGDFEVIMRDKYQMREDFKAYLGLLEVEKWAKKYETPFGKN